MYKYKIVKTVNGEVCSTGFHPDWSHMMKNLNRHLNNAFGKIEITDLIRYKEPESIESKFKKVFNKCESKQMFGDIRCECLIEDHECNILVCPKLVR